MRTFRAMAVRGRTRGVTLGLALLAASVALAVDPSPAPLRPAPSRLAQTSVELRARLREDPLVYFRFVNMEWAGRVCEAFRKDLRSVPTVVLHGDAHIEQYALTANAHGLDDFDDAAHGPSVVDLVRFLGSVDLIARRRGWAAEREWLFDRFLDGYTRALSDPSYLPSDPAVVKRLRAQPGRTRDEFFADSESLMQPVEPEHLEGVTRSFEMLEAMVRTVRPELPAGYFHPKKIGTLRIGVGSALSRKLLARVEGPSASPVDDVLLEAKELSRLESVPCMQVPISGEVFRVIVATKQIGRIRHELLLEVPRREGLAPEVRDWWIRSWDETFKEVTAADITSAAELGELAHDAGAQLGAANLRWSIPILETQMRRAEIAAVRRLAPRIRATARQLTDALLAGWEELQRSQPK